MCAILVFLMAQSAGAAQGASWKGLLSDSGGKPVPGALVSLRSGDHEYTAVTDANGKFIFAEIAPGSYRLSVKSGGKESSGLAPIVVKGAGLLAISLQLSLSGQVTQIESPQSKEQSLPTPGGQASAQASGGERLSSSEVSSLPLNARDFSKLLLLAAGTMTDTNGAANFTQQFAVNGQRGVTTVFAMDGFDTTDP
ncbi:MAG TPA: carboxypeptidase-like regulatory domain-containing protein, partial [Candidatus Sulfotelmatobacter sp.]|nr:carboxypeptidase-like regulatory domain-containing protein [Candidatus Sulfotelmatobacter sp.]